MEIPQDYEEKFRPRARKIGEPRNQREELIERFRVKLNEEQVRDGRPPLTYGRLAKRFESIDDSRLYQLFDECSRPEVRSFGAMLSYKLKNL
jgi:hypothetical protein